MSPEGHESLESMRKRTPNPFAAATLAQEGGRKEICASLAELCTAYEAWASALEQRLGQFEGKLRTAADGNLVRCKLALRRMREGVETLKTDGNAWSAFTLANLAIDRQAQFPICKGRNAKPLVWRPFQLGFLLLVLRSIAEQGNSDRDTMDLLWFPTGGGKTEAYLAITAFTIFLGRLREARTDVACQAWKC